MEETRQNITHAEDTPSTGRQRSWRSWLKFPRSWKEVKRLGWKFILAFVLFYLVRDTLLYILLPYLIYRGVISF